MPDSELTVVFGQRSCNFMQALEGDIDTSHFGFLHGGHVDANELPEDNLLRYTVQNRTPEYYVADSDWGTTYAAHRQAGDGRTYWRFANFLFPFWTQTPQGEFPHQVDIRAWVPMDDTHTMFVHLSWKGRKRAIGTVKKDGSPLPGFGFGHRYQPNTTDWHGRWRLQDGEANDWGIDREDQHANTTYSGIDNIHMQDQAVTESMGPITDHAFEHLAPSRPDGRPHAASPADGGAGAARQGRAAAGRRASRGLLWLARRLLLHPAAHRLAGTLCRAASRRGATS